MSELVKGRKCGDCRLCCRLPAVWERGTNPETGEAYEFKKPPMQWCSHAGPGGCGLYKSQSKPWACRVFNCFWLAGFGTDADRPDRVHAVLSLELVERKLYIYAFEAYEGCSQRNGVPKMIEDIAKDSKVPIEGVVFFSPNFKRRMVRWDGEPCEIVSRAGEDPNGMAPAPSDADDERKFFSGLLGRDIRLELVADPEELANAAERLRLSQSPPL